MVSVPQDGEWPMKIGDTGSVAEDQDDGLPYVRVDLDLKRKGALLIAGEIELLERQEAGGRAMKNEYAARKAALEIEKDCLDRPDVEESDSASE